MPSTNAIRLRCRRHYRHPLGLAGSLASHFREGDERRRAARLAAVPAFEDGDLIIYPDDLGAPADSALTPAEIAIPARGPAFSIGEVRHMRASDGTVLPPILVDVLAYRSDTGLTEWLTVLVEDGRIVDPAYLAEFVGPAALDAVSRRVVEAAALLVPVVETAQRADVAEPEPAPHPAAVIANIRGASADDPAIARIREVCDEAAPVVHVQPDPPAAEVIAELLDACAGPVTEPEPEEPGRQAELEPEQPVVEPATELETALGAALRKAMLQAESRRVSFYPSDPFEWFDLTGLARDGDVLVAPGSMLRGTVSFRDGSREPQLVRNVASAVVPPGATFARWSAVDAPAPAAPTVDPEEPLPSAIPNPDPMEEVAEPAAPEIDPVDVQPAEVAAAEPEPDDKAEASAAWTRDEDHKLLFGASKGTDPAVIAAALGRFEDEVYDRLDALVPGWGEQPKRIEKALKAMRERAA